MDNPAVIDDLAVRWYPNRLDTDEAVANAQVRLDDAWQALQDELPDLVDRIMAGSVSAASVIAVVTAAALRVMRNPEGYVRASQSIDDTAESWEASAESLTNDLYFTAAELRRLSGRARRASFTISPGR